MVDTPDIQAMLKERFAQLPKVVQNAITSSEVEGYLREMANTQKLHIDQWEALENEVKMTLFGVNPIDELQANIKTHVGVSDEVAAALAENVSKIVFQPIRVELEKELVQSEKPLNATPAITVAPATPPPLPPTTRVARAPVSAAYRAGEPSTERTSVGDDPYREPPT